MLVDSLHTLIITIPSRKSAPFEIMTKRTHKQLTKYENSKAAMNVFLWHVLLLSVTKSDLVWSIYSFILQ